MFHSSCLKPRVRGGYTGKAPVPEMGAGAKDQRHRIAGRGRHASRRQALGLGPRQVHDQRQRRLCHRIGTQQPDTARLDQRRRRRRAEGAACHRTEHPSSQTSRAPSAIKSSASRDLPLPAGPRISTPCPSSATPVARQKSRPSGAAAQCHSGRDRPRAIAQSGRPTTKRAPSGSEVMSASVGRMFSAQITPPCASTICLEIASPRPE